MAGLGALAGGAVARDLEDGWLLPPAWGLALAESKTVPATAPRLVSGTGRLFGMSELPLRFLGLRTALAGIRLRGDWQVLGSEAWREQTWRLEATAGERNGLGVVWTGRRIETSLAPLWSRTEVGLVLRLRPRPGWEVEIHSDPVSLTPDRCVSTRSPWLRLRGLAGAWAWAVSVDRRAHAAPRWRLGLSGRVAPGVVLGVLGEADTGALGVTSLWRRGGLGVRTSHLVHPQLGITHGWLLMLGGGS